MARKGMILKLSTKLPTILEKRMQDQQANEVDHVALNIYIMFEELFNKVEQTKMDDHAIFDENWIEKITFTHKANDVKHAKTLYHLHYVVLNTKNLKK